MGGVSGRIRDGYQEVNFLAGVRIHKFQFTGVIYSYENIEPGVVDKTFEAIDEVL